MTSVTAFFSEKGNEHRAIKPAPNVQRPSTTGLYESTKPAPAAPVTPPSASVSKGPGFLSSAWSNHAPEWAKNMKAWLGKPIGDIKWVNKGLTGAENGLGKIAEHGATKLAENGGKGFFGKALEFLGIKGVALFSSAKGIARGIPLAGVALTALFEIGDVAQGFKEDRGIAQTAKSVGNVAGSTAGVVLGAAAAVSTAAAAGAAVGTAICPLAGTIAGGAIGLIAGAIGAAVGYSASDAIGGLFFGNNKGDTEEEQHSVQNDHSQFGTMTQSREVHRGNEVFDNRHPLAGLPVLQNY